MKKTIIVVIGIIIFLGIVSSTTNKTTDKSYRSSAPSPTATVQSATAKPFNTPTIVIKKPTVTTSPYMSKEEYGRGVLSVSKKTIEAMSLVDLGLTLKTQNRYDEALEKLNGAKVLFQEAKTLNDVLKPPPQYQKSYDYYVKALDLGLESIKLEIQAIEHFKSGEIELSNIELKQALDIRKEAISYEKLSINTMR